MRTTFARGLLGSASIVAVAAVLAAGRVDPALAQTPTQVYAGGATLPAAVYRDMLNCFSRDLDVLNRFDPVTKGTCRFPVQNSSRWFGYAAVGSGAGINAFLARSSRALTVPATTNTVPYTTSSVTSTITRPDETQLQLFGDNPGTLNSVLLYNTTLLSSATSTAAATTGYPGYHWSGSDAVVSQSGWDCYNGVSGSTLRYNVVANAPGETPSPRTNVSRTRSCPTGTLSARNIAGPGIQVPTVGTSVNVIFNIPGRSSLRLSQRSVCGIFNGNITSWSDANITADNGGTVVSSQPIRVVVRADSSGTTELFVRSLETICLGSRGAIQDASITGFGVGPASTLPAVRGLGGASFGWSPRFYRAAGTEGVQQIVARNSFTIGYVSPEASRSSTLTSITIPATVEAESNVNSSGTIIPTEASGNLTLTAGAGTVPAPIAAAVQNRSNAVARLSNPALPRTFVTPNPSTTALALSSEFPPSGGLATSPVAWGEAVLAPDPTSSSGYPFVGFTLFLGYTCYNSTSVAQAVRGFLDVLTANSASCAGGDQYDCIAERNQFAPLPSVWRTAVRSLAVTGSSTRISGVSETGRAPVCNGKPGAGFNRAFSPAL